MIHKHSDSKLKLINMINYLANSATGKFVFYSFAEVVGTNYWAWLVDDVYYCALKITREPVDYCVSDECDREQAQIDQGLMFPLLLKGTDNTSYIKRFQDKNSMFDWARTVKNIDIDQDNSLLYYNS